MGRILQTYGALGAFVESILMPGERDKSKRTVGVRNCFREGIGDKKVEVVRIPLFQFRLERMICGVPIGLDLFDYVSILRKRTQRLRHRTFKTGKWRPDPCRCGLR